MGTMRCIGMLRAMRSVGLGGLAGAVVIAALTSAEVDAETPSEPVPSEPTPSEPTPSEPADDVGTAYIGSDTVDAVRASFAHVTRHVLPNGFEVVLDPLPAAPLVAVHLSVATGRRDQPEGWSGLAHLAEHLLFAPVAPGTPPLLARLEELGAVGTNAVTSTDRTEYFETIPRESLDAVLALEADRMAHGIERIDEALVAHERPILRCENGLADHTLSAAPSYVLALLYPAPHPYGRIEENDDDVAAIHALDVQGFLQRTYVPRRMRLAISGPIDPEATLARVTALFGALVDRPAPAIPEAPPTQLTAEHRVLVDVPREGDRLEILWSTPPFGTRDDATLDLVARVLELRLGARLEADHLLVGAVSVRQWSRELGSTFAIGVHVSARSGTAAPLAAVDAVLAELVEAPIPASELDSARAAYAEEYLASYASASARASLLSHRQLAAPDGWLDPALELDRHDARPAELRDVVRRWLPLDGRLVVSFNARRTAPREGALVTHVEVHHGPPTPSATPAASPAPGTR